MGTAIKYPVPESVRVPGCQKLQMTTQPGLAQDALQLYPHGNRGRQGVNDGIHMFLLYCLEI